MKKLISCMLLLVMALTLAPVTIISAADVTEYWHTVEDFESYTGSVPTSSVYSYNLTSGINTASDYLNSGKQSLVLSYAGGKKSPTVSVKAAKGLFSGDGIRIWYKVTTDTNISVVNAIFSDKSLKQLSNGEYFTPSQGTASCYLEYRYADAGFTAEDAADIIGIQIKFNLKPSASAREIYLDDLQVLNPPSFTKTIKGDELSLRNLGGSTINENQNVVSSGSKGYPQFYIDLPEPAYVSSVSVTLTNNDTENKLQLIKSGVGLKDVNDKVWNNLLGGVFNISAGGTSTLIIPVTADTLKTKIASIVIGANDTNHRMNVTVVSVTYTYAGNAAASVIDLKDDPIKFKTAYDSTSAAVRSVVDLHYDSSYYAPKMLTGSYRMDDAYHGQLQFGVSNPEEQTTKTLADDGYFISEVGVLMLPGTLLNGEELLLTNEQAAKASLSLKSADCAPATYFAVLSDSDKYNFADISARAYIKYSDGDNEVVFYSRNNAEENTAEYAANAVENGVLTCTRNYAARLAAQKCYDTKFYTETFPDSAHVNFSEAGTLEEVISYLNAYTRKNGGIAVIGDADANDIVDILDMIRIKKYLSDQAVKIDLKAADTNADGVNDPADLARLRKYLLGVEDLPAEPYTSDPVVTGVWTLL